MNVIKFYPHSEDAMLFSEPPSPATKFLPNWYKKTPAVIDNDSGLKFGNANTTVKKCMPIFDLMTAGYIISAPCDIFIDATNPERLTWSIPQTLASFKGDMFATHAREQYSEMPIDYSRYHKDLLRIFPLWVVGTQSGYSTMFMQPAYADKTPLLAMQAIVDTDTFISDGYFSFLVEKDFKGVIKQGSPLIQLIPFKRNDWKMEIASVEESEKKLKGQRLKVRSSFMNAYKNKFRHKKDYK